MAYPSSYFPVGYQYYQPVMQQPQNIQQTQQTQPTVQQNGFIRVQSENDARMYPVAPGSSVTFINDNAPYCYVKTMDLSQLDRPKFDKYRLVKEEDAPVSRQNGAETILGSDKGGVAYALKSDLDAIWGEIETIKGRLAKKQVRKVEDEDDE